jgi:ribosome-binding ATPase
MALSCGVIGLPNVGKSTFFNALSDAGAQVGNYAFCTIEPNVGMVEVPDLRLAQLARIAQSAQVIPAIMEFVDIAGLVKGAHKGEGLGNKFLAHIRETKALCHVLRCFEDPDVSHVDHHVDPVRDIETISLELCLADLQTLEKASQKHASKGKSGDKEAKLLYEACQHLIKAVSEGLLHGQDLSKEQVAVAKDLGLLSIKPQMYVANVDEDMDESNPHYQAVCDYAKKQGAQVLMICAKIESELALLPEEEKKEFLASLGYEEPGLNRVIRAGYSLLDLQTFFTLGPKEARAWTMSVGGTALQASGEIHTDFIKHFIRAEVIPYQAYLDHQGEQGAKAAGLWQLEGKDYIVSDGDVMYFRISK